MRPKIPADAMYVVWICAWLDVNGRGIDARRSYHKTLPEALARIDVEEEPFAVANLEVESGMDTWPCDVDGLPFEPGRRIQRFARYGSNGYRADHAALRAAWPRLIQEIREIRARTSEGTVDIALRLLKERHPTLKQFFHQLGEAAAR